MAPFPKFISLSVLAGGLLSVAGCREGTSSQANPNPKTPPLKIEVTGPTGSRQGDSASFDKIMRGEMDPDTLHLAKPRTKRNP